MGTKQRVKVNKSVILFLLDSSQYFLIKMSSRALRKLQQEKDAKELQLGASDEEVSIVRPVTGARTRRPNPFDLLNADSLSESEVKEDDDLGHSEISLKALESQKRKQR